MEQNLLVDNWVRFYSHKNQESDDDEALSLCDLATNDHNESPSNDIQQHEEHFDFGSPNLPKNKMCSADELFFQGQIMPVTLPSGFMNRTISCSKSEPVSVGSSRSSSTRSHNSATSGSSSTSGPEFTRRATQSQNRNQFHSHPSPTPQIRTRGFHHYNSKSSSSLSKWRYFQLGPVKPQEIGLADLKNRSQRSQGSCNKSMKDDQNQKNKMLLFGGCKCTANVVESTVSSSSSSLMVKRERILNLKKEQLWKG